MNSLSYANSLKLKIVNTSYHILYIIRKTLAIPAASDWFLYTLRTVHQF